jgi:NADPH-dependent ferric siderophore reductase
MADRGNRNRPQNVRLYRAEVVASRRCSPSWQRVTVTGDDLADFPYLGFDQWFRLFVPLPGQAGLQLPELNGSQWWKPYLEIPEEVRPHCANYTVADFRSATRELDIDFVLHRGAGGDLEGQAAIWACTTQPGDPLAVLDQGTIFDLPADADTVVMVADETGLPGVSNILTSLPAHTRGHLIQEVPTALDQRELVGPPGIEVTWVTRTDPHLVPGVAALTELRRQPARFDYDYAYVVGESSLATAGRRHLHKMGLPKDRITFSGYWRHASTESDAG